MSINEAHEPWLTQASLWPVGDEWEVKRPNGEGYATRGGPLVTTYSTVRYRIVAWFVYLDKPRVAVEMVDSGNLRIINSAIWKGWVSNPGRAKRFPASTIKEKANADTGGLSQNPRS